MKSKQTAKLGSLVRAIAFVAGFSGVLSLSARADEPLPELLTIEWRRGPDLPQGLQDSDGGALDGVLISVGGFCSGQKGIPGKETIYPRGFLKKTWGLPLTDAAARVEGRPSDRWFDLPAFPGAARQGLDAAVVGRSLWCWGGFSYDAPFTYRDGYRLSRETGEWKWTALPALPHALCAQGTCVIGEKIYGVGGADYDGETGFFTEGDRRGATKRLGARLLVFDTARPDAGWTERTPLPGTPRFVHAVATVGGKLFVFGGATGSDNPEKGTFTVVDNWRYDPAADAWDRLADLPVASGNFPSGPIVFANRYVLLVGGYQYGQVRDPDGTKRAVYGKPTRHDSANAMCSDVFVYDTKANRFGRATPFPLNNNLPMTVVEGNRVFLIGGEIGDATVEGVRYGHHPELVLVGTIREMK